MTAGSDVELVHLRGGLVTTAGALRILWHLEDRGFAITLEHDRLFVRPPSRLTSADVVAIRRHRDELVQLVRYTPDDRHLFTSTVPSATPAKETQTP